MFRRCTVALILLGWAAALGVHWPALQVVAWARMAADYAPAVGWPAAWRMAVDGPRCHRCVAIERGRAATPGPTAPAAAPRGDDRLQLALPRPAFRLVCLPTVEAGGRPGRSVVHHGRARPPVPPPRTA